MLANKRKVTYVMVAAVTIAVVGTIIFINANMPSAEEKYTGVTREFYLFNTVEKHIEEEEAELHIPPDQFTQTQITVRKGDTVIIHFYNIEPKETEEHHSFTIKEKPYEMDYDLSAGEHVEIKFVAEKTGVWQYECKYHQPTMRGQLVVLR